MNYSQTLNYLLNALPVYHKVGMPAYKGGLANAKAMDKYFLFPHRAFPVIHVAGTNGKGSVSHMLASVYREAGYSTGLFTSPHLIDFRERIRVNGQMIEKDYCAAFVSRHKEWFDTLQPSFFELSVFLAFSYFRDMGVDVAIVETGLGGRLDTTNVVTPVISVITNIGLDHTHLLGHTPEAIAAEKAGIIKPQIPVVIGMRQSGISDVFIRAADNAGSLLVFATDRFTCRWNDDKMDIFRDGSPFLVSVDLQLKGLYQQLNVPAVMQILSDLQPLFSVNPEQIRSGLCRVMDNTGLMGRWQQIASAPRVICDVCHNADGVAQAMNQLRKQKYNKLHIVFGLVADKDAGQILRLLPKEAGYYFTRANIPRALDVECLMNSATHYGLQGKGYGRVAEAYHAACAEAGESDLVFIGGSTFIVAEVLSLFQEDQKRKSS